MGFDFKNLFKSFAHTGLKSLDLVMPGLGSFASDTAQNIGGQFASRAIEGIPMPWDKTPAQQGKDMRSMMDNAFPGTSVWDKLGAGGAGTAASVQGQQQLKVQQRMQSKQLRSQERIARMQTRSQERTAAISQGPLAVDAVNHQQQFGGWMPHYNAMPEIAAQRLPAEIKRLEAETGLNIKKQLTEIQRAALTGHQATIEGAMASYADFLAANRLIGTGVGKELLRIGQQVAGKVTGKLKHIGRREPTSIGPQAPQRYKQWLDKTGRPDNKKNRNTFNNYPY